MLNSGELHELAQRFSLPKRLLSEAQEVLLYHGVKRREVAQTLKRLCESARAQGGGVAVFDKLLKGQIAILRVKE